MRCDIALLLIIKKLLVALSDAEPRRVEMQELRPNQSQVPGSHVRPGAAPLSLWQRAGCGRFL